MDIATNTITPMDTLRSEYSYIMASLVYAVEAAQNWDDTRKAADAMVSVHIKFKHLLAEYEHFYGFQGLAGATEQPIDYNAEITRSD